MVYRVVSTKLTEEEHNALMEICNKLGNSPSLFLKKTILERMNSMQKPLEHEVMQEILESKEEARELEKSSPFPELRQDSELEKLARLLRAASKRPSSH